MKNISSRWCTKEEMKSILTAISDNEKVKRGGITFFKEDNTMYLDDDNSNVMVFANEHSKKEENIIAPFIDTAIEAGESIVINDVSGKMYDAFFDKLKVNDYNIKVFDLDEPRLGNGFNPLILPYRFYKDNKKDMAINILEDIAFYIFNDDNKEADSFWKMSSSDYFMGLSLYLFENAKEEEINISSVSYLSSLLEGIDNEKRNSFLSKFSLTSSIYKYLKGTLLSPYDTMAGIMATFNQKMNLLVSRDELMVNMANDDFEIDKVGTSKMAIFVINGFNKTKCLVPMIISELFYSTYVYGDYKNRFNFILNDFDNMVRFSDDFYDILSKSSDSNIKFLVFVSSYSNLINKYGMEFGNMINMCFKANIYLLSDDMELLTRFASLCGDLISKEELRLMDSNSGIVLIPRMYPFKMEFEGYKFSNKKCELSPLKSSDIKIYKDI